MSTGTHTCDVILPGYTLTERIGSGGYADVWRAEAPGGIEKAVKIVHGYYDDEFASQELKALERIKGVRHPFLLSLERFEILNGRLAILTELADMSLDQRRQQCRAEGLPGIPRDELLRYMADAAEALDFLSQRHSLLHLDVKPENLLVSGDHVKVADFGLVKELATRTQNSLVAGMTPTYAAPEIFDDDPSAFSDQYSLAIVYQEMLVGTLPFPGRTAAQLAKQHTQSEPQLTSVPDVDRPVLSRALSKKPTDRYPSSKAFVDALLGRTTASPSAPSVAPPRTIPPAPRPTTPETDDTKPPSFTTTLRRDPERKLAELDVEVTQPIRRDESAGSAPRSESPTPVAPFVAGDIADIAVPATNDQLRREQPTLYVAAGGVGIQVLSRLLALTASRDESDESTKPIECIALDTNRDDLREACSIGRRSSLSPDDAMHLPLRLPKDYDNSREILGWVSRRWLYNIPRSLETRGYRPLGRVALVDHSQRVLSLIDQKLERLGALVNTANDAGDLRDSTVKIVLLAGTGGGTGGGMIIDLANAVRSIAGKRKLPVEIHSYLICNCFASINTQSPLAAANTYSLLTELNHIALRGNEGTSDAPRIGTFESTHQPFDHVYWVPVRARGATAQSVDPLEPLAKCLALDWKPEPRALFRSCRSSPTPREQSLEKSLSLRQMGYASLSDQKHAWIGETATRLAQAVKRHWLTLDTSADWQRLVREAQQAASEQTHVPANNGNADASRTVAPGNDATPLSFRARFKEHMSLEFASEVLWQIQRQTESRDDRGQPLLSARDAKLLADNARGVVMALAGGARHDLEIPSPGTDTHFISALVAPSSRRVLEHAVERFDPAQPERFLSVGSLDEVLRDECYALLEEHLLKPETTATIASRVDLDKSASMMLESASADAPEGGYDRRTLVFVPHNETQAAVVAKLRNSRPLSAVVPATVDDVIIVSEESGMSPRSLALKLEHVFPGIGEAARRLLTRTDIEWLDLKS